MRVCKTDKNSSHKHMKYNEEILIKVVKLSKKKDHYQKMKCNYITYNHNSV